MGLLQYGVCTFEWSSEAETYIARPFSFHLMPRQGPLGSTSHESGAGGEAIFHTSAGALQFLLENSFDFQALVKGGISYLSRQSEARLRHMHRLRAMRLASKNFSERPVVPAMSASGGEAQACADTPRVIVVDVPPPPGSERPGIVNSPPSAPKQNEIRITHPKDAEWYESLVLAVDKWEQGIKAWLTARQQRFSSEDPTLSPLQNDLAIEDLSPLSDNAADSTTSSLSFPYLRLPPANGFKRLLVRTLVESKWPSQGVHAPCVQVMQRLSDQVKDGNDYEKILRLVWVGEGTAGIQAFECASLQKSVAEVDSAIEACVGFRKVIDRISQRGVPVVGHNCWLDFSHSVSKFVGSPSPSVSQWAAQLASVFPCVFDTKHLIASHLVCDPITTATFTGKNSLGQAFNVVSGTSNASAYLPKLVNPAENPGNDSNSNNNSQPCARVDKVELERVEASINWPELAPIVMAPGYQKDSSGGGEAVDGFQQTEVAHDAGYDAFMTGVVFARVSARFASLPALAAPAPPSRVEAAAAGATTTTAAKTYPENSSFSDLLPFSPFDPRVGPPLTPLPASAFPTLFSAPPPRLKALANTLHVMSSGAGVFTSFLKLDDARSALSSLTAPPPQATGGDRSEGGTETAINTLSLARSLSYRGNYIHVSGLDLSLTDREVMEALGAGVGIDVRHVKFWRVDETSGFSALPTHEHAISAVEASCRSATTGVGEEEGGESMGGDGGLSKTFSHALSWFLSKLTGDATNRSSSSSSSAQERNETAAGTSSPPHTSSSTPHSPSSSSNYALSTLDPSHITPALVKSTIRSVTISDFSVQTYASFLKEHSGVFGDECAHEVVPRLYTSAKGPSACVEGASSEGGLSTKKQRLD